MHFVDHVVKSFREAIDNEYNWKSTGPRWTFIEADVFMATNPKTPEETKTLYRIFNDMADMHSAYYKDLNYGQYKNKLKEVEEEYKDLFGIKAG